MLDACKATVALDQHSAALVFLLILGAIIFASLLVLMDVESK